jgi:hypothetical protein
VKSSRNASLWARPASSVSLVLCGLSRYSIPHMPLHSSMAKETPIMLRYSERWKLASAIEVNFLSLPTMGIHYWNLVRWVMYFFLYSSITLVNFCLLSALVMNSFQPSIMSGFSPLRLSYRVASWPSNCLTTMKRRPSVYLPESLTSGKSRVNSCKKRIQLTWHRYCYSGVAALLRLGLWCSDLGLLPILPSDCMVCSWF